MSNGTRPGRSDPEPPAAVAVRERLGDLAGKWTMGIVWSGAGAWTLVHQVGLEPGEILRPLLVVTWITLVLASPGRWLFTRSWQALEGKHRAGWLMACVAAGGLLGRAVPIEDTPLRGGEDTVQLSLVLASSLFFGLLLWAVGAWLILRRPPQHQRPDPNNATSAPPTAGRFGKWEWLALATPPAVAWTAYLLAFWPAVMSFDSLEQWVQLRTGDFNNWHPVFHTLTEWALTRLVESPAIVAAAQVAALSGVVGWALASMRRLGLPMGAAWFLSGAVAVWPANGITVITLWKDIPYAIAVLALGLILLREIDGRHRVIDTRRGWALLVGVATLVSLYHHAGLIVAMGSLGVLWLAKRQTAILGAALVALAVVAMVQGGLYRAVGVSGTDHPGITGAATHHIAAHLASGTELTASEQSEIAELIPIQGSAWYDCESINAMIFDPEFSIDSMHEQTTRALTLWWSLFTRDPGVDLGHLACKSHVVWHIRQVPGGYHYVSQLVPGPDGAVSTILANDLGLEQDPIVDSLTRPLADVVVKTQRPLVAWLFWRGALFLYVLLGAASVAALRARDWRYLAVVVPPVLVAGALVLAAPAQDYRYMYPVVLSSMILAPYLLFAVPKAADSQQQTDG